ncbi:hypothetical protein B0H34DRAFT_660832 [Crassisporium funariophilum]|nr:hypothetical protein B0H34DRAFT_660832 [Crassisporium funariophilum]
MDITTTTSVHLDDLRSDRACFDGMLVAALAYGALVMIYIQLTEVLIRRPKRGRVFWFIVCYSTALFPLSTVAFAGKIKFAEWMYVIHRDYPQGPKAYYADFAGLWPNVMSQTSTTLLPWIGDILMMYRLMVIWNYQWWLMVVPGTIYLARVAMSVPLLMAQTHPHDPRWASHSSPYGTVYYSLCVSLNLIITILICVRIFMMRHKAEKVLGKLQASFYNSTITILVESGAFFTIWAVAYLISRQKCSWVEDVFLQPYTYIIAITRMLIILRMAQDRAWSKDIISAASNGILDWQVSSTSSIPLGDHLPPGNQKLPKKFREDSLSCKSLSN